MTLAFYTHRDMLEHRPGERHVERPERLAAVMCALEAASDLDLAPNDAPMVDVADLLTVHDQAYLETIPPPARGAQGQAGSGHLGISRQSDRCAPGRRYRRPGGPRCRRVRGGASLLRGASARTPR